MNVYVLEGFDRDKDDIMEATVIFKIRRNLLLDEVESLFVPGSRSHLRYDHNQLNNTQSFS